MTASRFPRLATTILVAALALLTLRAAPGAEKIRTMAEWAGQGGQLWLSIERNDALKVQLNEGVVTLVATSIGNLPIIDRNTRSQAVVRGEDVRKIHVIGADDQDAGETLDLSAIGPGDMPRASLMNTGKTEGLQGGNDTLIMGALDVNHFSTGQNHDKILFNTKNAAGARGHLQLGNGRDEIVFDHPFDPDSEDKRWLVINLGGGTDTVTVKHMPVDKTALIFGDANEEQQDTLHYPHGAKVIPEADPDHDKGWTGRIWRQGFGYIGYNPKTIQNLKELPEEEADDEDFGPLPVIE